MQEWIIEGKQVGNKKTHLNENFNWAVTEGSAYRHRGTLTQIRRMLDGHGLSREVRCVCYAVNNDMGNPISFVDGKPQSNRK